MVNDLARLDATAQAELVRKGEITLALLMFLYIYLLIESENSYGLSFRLNFRSITARENPGSTTDPTARAPQHLRRLFV